MNWTLPWPWMVKHWKPLTFFCGLSLLIWGALYEGCRDWDISVSILMALSTYLSADRFVEACFRLNWKKVLIWSPAAWWAVDGVYWLYWTLVDTTAMLRSEQWLTSLCLYLMCGFLWFPARSEMLATVPAQPLYTPE